MLIFNKKEITVPNIVGKNVSEGLLILAKKKLDLRLLRTQEESNIPEGTIVYQTPQENNVIRPSQHIFIIVSQKPKTLHAPDFSSYTKEQIIEWCNKHGKTLKIHNISYNKPKGKVIGQCPYKDEPFEQLNLTIYISNESCKINIMPNFKGLSIKEAEEFLSKNNISYEIINKNSLEDNSNQVSIIGDQRPEFGAVIDLSKKLFVQLYAST